MVMAPPTSSTSLVEGAVEWEGILGLVRSAEASSARGISPIRRKPHASCGTNPGPAASVEAGHGHGHWLIRPPSSPTAQHLFHVCDVIKGQLSDGNSALFRNPDSWERRFDLMMPRSGSLSNKRVGQRPERWAGGCVVCTLFFSPQIQICGRRF